ncbi:hypothetical protein PENSPDRAFT_581118 [Peniophora sp. CONT]|nr:hypothetical protein PENSPDRAFT_581118 [Peniophora sp. CONT]
MQQAQAARQQAANLPKPDPRLQAAIEASYVPVDIELTEPSNSNVKCTPHKLEKCDDCGLDFVDLNRIAKIFVSNPNLRCPPPPNVITKQLSDVINKTKEEGNTLFRTRQHGPAIQRYTQAANFALQRPPWEPSAIVREEVSTIMSNRSASYFEAGEYVAALCDAEIVIQLKKGWSKGYFRKAKALVGLNDLPAAKEAIVEGLLFEPDNKVSLTL